VKHLLILISFLLLSPFLTSCEKYVGEYKDGKRNGQGTITWSDGKNYVGEFKDGKFNGHGKLTWSDGGNGRTDDHMVKELEHYLMEESMLGNTRMGKNGMVQYMTMTESTYQSI